LSDPYKSKKTTQAFVLLALFCLFLLIRNLFLLKLVQPIGYIINIYPIFPLSFYLGFIFCYLVATILVLSGKKTLGTLILCINHFEILIIPYMLGYYSMGRADDMSYIGEYLQIVNSGHFAYWDIYPDSHIIGASISLISDLDAHLTSFIIPIIFSFIFIAGIYLFSRELFPNYCIQSLVLVSSFILYLGIYNFLNTPNALFFSFMPLYLCYFYKYISQHNNFSYSIILIIMSLMISFSHPFIVFFLLSVFMFHFVPMILPIPYIDVFRIPRARINNFLLLVFAFTSWLFYNEFFSNVFKANFIAFINKITQPVFVEATNSFDKIGFGFFDYVQLLSLYYGRYLIPTFIIIASFVYLYYNKNILETKIFKNYLYLFSLYILFLFIQIMLLFNPIISHKLDRIANLNFVVYAQIPLFACSLYLLFLRHQKSISKIFLVSLILSLVWSLSLFGCFDSPNVYRPNAALAYNEVNGMKWFYEAKNESSTTGAPLSQISRFHDLFGYTETIDRLNYFDDHFGYNNTVNSLIDTNSKLIRGSYIIILTIDELLYQEVPAYKHVGRYTSNDFARFRRDISVNQIYDSLNIQINII
jgi:hypothetical protein